MKQKDIATIIIVAAVAGVAALIISNLFLASDSQLATEVEVVEPISAEFPTPDSRYFNDDAVNPTQLIRIEENQNKNPFR